MADLIERRYLGTWTVTAPTAEGDKDFKVKVFINEQVLADAYYARVHTNRASRVTLCEGAILLEGIPS